MSQAVLLVAAVIACAVGMPLLIWGISKLRDGLDRRRFGVPQERTKAQQTLVDLLRARGYTRRLAEQTVDGLANDPPSGSSFPEMSEADERAVAEQFRQDFLNGKLPPEIEKMYAEAILETTARNGNSRSH